MLWQPVLTYSWEVSLSTHIPFSERAWCAWHIMPTLKKNNNKAQTWQMLGKWRTAFKLPWFLCLRSFESMFLWKLWEASAATSLNRSYLQKWLRSIRRGSGNLLMFMAAYSCSDIAENIYMHFLSLSLSFCWIEQAQRDAVRNCRKTGHTQSPLIVVSMETLPHSTLWWGKPLLGVSYCCCWSSCK